MLPKLATIIMSCLSMYKENSQDLKFQNFNKREKLCISKHTNFHVKTDFILYVDFR